MLDPIQTGEKKACIARVLMVGNWRLFYSAGKFRQHKNKSKKYKARPLDITYNMQ